MNITILTDNPNSWILPYVEDLKNILIKEHKIHHVYNTIDIIGGDIMLVLSCEKILKKQFLELHKSNVVVHPSKVPQGKGWSPLAWQILEGVNKIPVSLFEAVEEVDAGNVYKVDYIELDGSELNVEIKHLQGVLTINMVKWYIDNFNSIVGVPQIGNESFYAKRREKDNELDVDKTITEQFNLLRVVDNNRYPAHFFYKGNKYILKVYKDI
jgi:methionyl-tRNA formyltransferase